jgi:A/G-specific adenine glycosylase
MRIPAFRRRLLGWYRVHRRDLPWRRTRDPYAIFVSEMMLQQTQVSTVVPYFRRFLSTFPRWSSLARAPEDRVLKAWEGLGYYRRARDLKRAARLVVRPFRGRLPDTRGAVLLLPGVGEYSAGALLSIAYGKPFPLVDGNVARVYARLLRLPGDPRSGRGRRRVWEVAQRMLDARHPGDFNQALMELGATVCTPVAPDCGRCPVRVLCEARGSGDPERYPPTRGSRRTFGMFSAAVLCIREGRVLIRKRPKNARWLSGMWEFPTADAGSMREARERLEGEWGGRLEKDPLVTVHHQITHHKIRLSLFRSLGRNGPSGRWVQPRALERHPFPSAQGRLRRWVLSNLAATRSLERS